MLQATNFIKIKINRPDFKSLQNKLKDCQKKNFGTKFQRIMSFRQLIFNWPQLLIYAVMLKLMNVMLLESVYWLIHCYLCCEIWIEITIHTKLKSPRFIKSYFNWRNSAQMFAIIW